MLIFQRELFYQSVLPGNLSPDQIPLLLTQRHISDKMSIHSPKKSSSLGTIATSDPSSRDIMDHEIIALTSDVKRFSDSLARLKQLFTEGIDPEEDARVVIHEGLGEVLSVLNPVMQHYTDLQSPEIFTAARNLITMIKDHDYEEEMTSANERDFCDAINQLALAFSSSVSEYLMGDMGPQLVMDLKTKSMNNIAIEEASEHHEAGEAAQMSPEEIDGILVNLEKGLSIALQRAKVWSRYITDIITYIERKSQLELDYAKNLSRLANTVQSSLKKEAFLPLQSIYCTALTQDVEYASNLQATQAVLHSHKFVEPLTIRRAEHDKVYKYVKEAWHRECKRMADTITNLRKAHTMYMNRQQDHERAHELALKTDGEKQEKRRKAEEEAMHKAAEAETTYKACVAEANNRQQELFKIKSELLARIREQIQLCDQVIRDVSVDYFKLYNTVMSPLPLQYQTLSESSRSYQPGSQYAEYVHRLPNTNRSCQPEVFAFEPYVQGQKSSSVDTRKESFHSNGSVSDNVHSPEGSPVTSPRRDKYRIPVKAWGQQVQGAGTSDTDSTSCSSKSHESSPSGSPHRATRRHLTSSQSLDEVTEEEMLAAAAAAAAHNGQERRIQTMKRTVTVAGNDNLDLPGLLMLHRGRRNTTFGVDFQEQVDNFQTKVPPIVSKCLSEIDKRGVMIKGIYRVSGVKSKVEHLCQRFDIDPGAVDLEDVHPNVISNVLKLYLRQLPEPLLTFRLYSDFIHAAKENMSGHLFGDHLLDHLKKLVSRLPSSNLRTCAVLMHHLHRVASHSEMNQMSASNLGIVFGPTLLRPLEGSASLASLVDTPHQTRAIELLITHAHVIFGPSEDFQIAPTQTPVEQLNQVLSGVLLPGQGFRSDHLAAAQKTKVSQASTESDDTSLPVFESPSSTPGAISTQTSACEFVLPGTASQERHETISLSINVASTDNSQPARTGTSPLSTATSVELTVPSHSKSTVTKSSSSPHMLLSPRPQMSSSLSMPGAAVAGSGSDMAAALSTSMSGMAAALMSSAGFSSPEISSSSGVSHYIALSDSASTDRTSPLLPAVQESSTVRTSDDRTSLDEHSKKKLHSQQLQNIKFLTKGPGVDEPRTDSLPREMSTVQVEAATVASQKYTNKQGQRLAVSFSAKDPTMTKIPSAPDVLETAVESRKKQVIVITPKLVQEPARFSPFPEAPSSRSSILEEMPIPTLNKSAADGSGQDDGAGSSMTIPASPTIKRREMPSKIPTSPGSQRSADARYGGERLDNRADKFRQEQRKLVKAIKTGASVTGHPIAVTGQVKESGCGSVWEHKIASEILENVVSGGCALSSRPSSLSEEVGGEAELLTKEEWKGESTPSPDETDSDACRSDMSTASQTTSSMASQESAFPLSPGQSGAWTGKSDSSKSGAHVGTKQRLTPTGGEGTSSRATSGRAKPQSVPSASLSKKQASSSSPVTKAAVPTSRAVMTSTARTTSCSSSVSPKSSSQARSPSSKQTSSTGAAKQMPSASTLDQSLKMCSKIPASISKTSEDTSSSKSSSPVSRKSSGRGGDLPSPPASVKFSEESSPGPESALRSDVSSIEAPSPQSSLQQRQISGETSPSQSSRVMKPSQRKPAASSANPTGSPRKIHERCQLEKSVVVPKSAGQQGSSTPKLATPRPSQLPASVATASSVASSPTTPPTSAPGKLSQDRTPRFV